jgi:hypothetical protein
MTSFGATLSKHKTIAVSNPFITPTRLLTSSASNIATKPKSHGHHGRIQQANEELVVTEMCLLPLPRRVTISQYPLLRLPHTPYIPNPAPELGSVAPCCLSSFKPVNPERSVMAYCDRAASHRFGPREVALFFKCILSLLLL